MRYLLPVAALSLLSASPLAAAAGPIAPIDAKLQAREWEAARRLAVEELDGARGSLYAPYLAAVVARLAVAEAALGLTEDGIWHWGVAQNLDRGALSPAALASFGEAGSLLGRHPLRRPGEAPAGARVYRPEEAAGGVRAARKVSGDPPQLSAIVAGLPVPKALHVEALIDVDGRVREPVVVGGGAPGLVWEVLEGLRAWRYEPGRRGDEAVAVFHDLRLDTAPRLPIGEMVTLSKEAAAAEALLRTGGWEQAERSARRAWTAALDARQPRRELLAATLALDAVAEAGLGRVPSAICRWQAAQHVDERLYGADLSAYREAGALLDGHRWGTPPSPVTSAASPAWKHIARTRLPRFWMRSKLRGYVLLTATVDEHGGIQQPLVVAVRSDSRGEGKLAPFTYAPGPLGYARLGAIAALDALCASTFEPARVAEGPVSSRLVAPLTFGAPTPIVLPVGGVGGGNRSVGGPNGWSIIDNSRPPLEVYTGGPP